MKLVVGLGNIGKEYENTRHNVGFMFLDYLKDKYNFTIDKQKSSLESIIGETVINSQKVCFIKPTTFMNLSGNAIVKVKNWYKVDISDILVIFDDIDIDFGTVRYRAKGSGGTHNGMKNIVQMLNSKDFARVRIGIGGIKNEHQPMIDFVLQRFTKREIETLNSDIFAQAEEKLLEFLDK